MRHRVPYDMHSEALQSKDPGDAGTITADRYGQTVLLVSATAETRTLARPILPGIPLTLVLKTDGGDVTVTVTGGYNPAGTTTLVFSNAGEYATFVSVVSGSTYSWKLIATNAAGVEGLALADDQQLSFGSGNDVQMVWDTVDANANLFKIEMPTATAVNVPVILVGQGIENVDHGFYNGAVDPIIGLTAYGATTTGAALEFRKARGTAAAPTVVTAGDDLGYIDFFTCVAAGEYVRGARIHCDAESTQATTRGPASLTISTATDAAPSVLTAALTISKAQLVTLATGAATGDFKLNLTLTAGADGVGSAGEQLTSGGAAAETSWTAAACLREYKDVLKERDDARQALETLAATPVYDFKYRRKTPDGPRVTNTGDEETVYTGIMADEAGWATHHEGRILNPVNALGYTVLAFRAVAEENRVLRERLDALETKLNRIAG